MTSSNGNIFRVTGPLCGEFTGPGEFPAQRPVTRSFDVSFDLRLNTRLSKQPWGWWFETLSWSLWRQCNVRDQTAIISLFSTHNWIRDYRKHISIFPNIYPFNDYNIVHHSPQAIELRKYAIHKYWCTLKTESRNDTVFVVTGSGRVCHKGILAVARRHVRHHPNSRFSVGSS